MRGRRDTSGEKPILLPASHSRLPGAAPRRHCCRQYGRYIEAARIAD